MLHQVLHRQPLGNLLILFKKRKLYYILLDYIQQNDAACNIKFIKINITSLILMTAGNKKGDVLPRPLFIGLCCRCLVGSAGQLHHLLGERVGEEDDHRHNENVDSEGLDHRQTDHHGGQNLAACARIPRNALNSFLDGQTLTNAGSKRTKTHADTGSQHTPREKFHLSYSFSGVVFVPKWVRTLIARAT